MKIIHDYNSGVGYIINKNKGNCTTFSIGSLNIDALDDAHDPNGFLTLKSPESLFHLDDTYYYAGQVEKF